LLVVFGLGAIRWFAPATGNPGTPPVADAGSSGSIAAVTDQPIVKESDSTSTGFRRKLSTRVKAGAPVKARSANAANNEIATDFLPMTYGGAANLQEGGQMVRVELPRSAMASFGLPVNMDRSNERVKADVLLGVDGLAHAIRFVR